MTERSTENVAVSHDDEFVPDRYMPIRRVEIVAALAGDPRLAEGDGPLITALARRLGRLFHVEYFDRRETLRDLYVALNPDQPGDAPLAAPDGIDQQLMTELRSVIDAANFTELSPEELAESERRMGRVRATVRIPWELYSKIQFFARGRRILTINWKSLFGLKKNSAQAITYDQVVMVARVRPDPPAKSMRRSPLRPGALYLKLFRDIPAADLNTLFPNGRVIIGLFDKAVIGVPALVAGVPILLNIIPALSVLLVVIGAYLGVQGTVEGDHMKQALAALSGLGALVGFLMRQWVKYERQALKYQKQVSDNAYFKNINNNGAFFDFIIGASEESEVKETILVYFFLAVANGPVRRADLDKTIEAWLRERFGVAVDFDIDDAIAKLEQLGIAARGDDGYTVVPLEVAVEKARRAWIALADDD